MTFAFRRDPLFSWYYPNILEAVRDCLVTVFCIVCLHAFARPRVQDHKRNEDHFRSCLGPLASSVTPSNLSGLLAVPCFVDKFMGTLSFLKDFLKRVLAVFARPALGEFLLVWHDSEQDLFRGKLSRLFTTALCSDSIGTAVAEALSTLGGTLPLSSFWLLVQP